MLFNSVDFAIFLPVVFLTYWFVCRGRTQRNSFLVVASYYFYGSWDWRFLFLIVASSFVDFFIGLHLEKDYGTRSKKLLLVGSIVLNLGLLGFFKYFNFFIDTFEQTFLLFGHQVSTWRLDIILPVGISFYTFQTLSYSIDVYREKIPATKSMVDFFAFVCFFPQLVAGPIERAQHLLPQFGKEHRFRYDKAVDGLRQALWGLFKKMVIADNCAIVVDEIFGAYLTFSASTLLLGAALFAIQIYGDFSGYSDIAIGTSRLFGFDLKQNFKYPYFSRSVAEFWRRWHISLSTWFRDYIYIPLGGSRRSKLITMRNVFVIFLVSGFWHGANFTFIVWGGLHALLFMPSLLLGHNRSYVDTVAEGRYLPSVRELLLMLRTFVWVTLAWIFFRAPTVQDAWAYLTGIFSPDLFTLPHFRSMTLIQFVTVAVIICIGFWIEWLGRFELHALGRLDSRVQSRNGRWLIYYSVIAVVCTYAASGGAFIYFQF